MTQAPCVDYLRSPAPASRLYNMNLNLKGGSMFKHRLPIIDPNIKGQIKKEIKKTVQGYIHFNHQDGSHVLVDDIMGVTQKLQLTQLFQSISRNKGNYVNRADFTDERGRHYTLEFLIAKGDQGLYLEKTNVYPYSYNGMLDFNLGHGVQLKKAS
jgi:hypothetical protein